MNARFAKYIAHPISALFVTNGCVTYAQIAKIWRTGSVQTARLKEKGAPKRQRRRPSPEQNEKDARKRQRPRHHQKVKDALKDKSTRAKNGGQG